MKTRIFLCLLCCTLSAVIAYVVHTGGLGVGRKETAELKERLSALEAQLAAQKAAPQPDNAPVSPKPEPAKPAPAPEPVPGAAVKKPRIGLSLDTLKEERWQRDRDTFVARARALGAEVITLAANSDDVQQVKDCNSLLAQGVDALVIVPHNGDAMSRVVNEASAAGVPVCSYDRLINNCDLAYYCTFDNVKVGELQGRFLMERLFPGGPLVGAEKKRIARIYGAPTDNNAKLFREGQNAALKPYVDSGQLEIVFEDWAEDWKPENGKKIAQAALTKAGPAGLHGILASNDGTAGGAIQALIEEKLTGKVLVTGQDADGEACRRIVRGEQTMTVYKPLKNLAEGAADLAVALAKKQVPKTNAKQHNGKRDVPTLHFDIIAVHSGNLRETVIKDGFHKEADIFGK